MSINLDLQNWHDASFPLPPTTTPSALLQMMNRSAAEEDGHDSSLKSSQPVFTSEQQQQQQMLNFSAGNHKVPHLPHFYNNPASHYTNPDFTGYNNYCGGATTVHDLFNGPFTPSQWMELEQQALIYKHITSNAPLPSSTLLTPVRRASSHAAFSRYNFGHFSSLGWGGFDLGQQNSNDPEPGRCRRTDGKKWRCSRDAVTDQKYCERHINRGRHRSRKPVEGQSHYSIGKSLPTLSAVLPGNTGCSSNGSNPDKHKILHNHQGNSAVPISRKSCDGGICVDSMNLLVPQPSLSLYNIYNSKPAESCGQLFESDFGLVSSDALKNPSGQSIRPHSTSIRRFIDDCPKNQPDHTSTMWPNSNDTQLSISIPTAYQIKDGPSPSSLTLAWELSSMPMGLELGGNKHTLPESDDKVPNWIPTLRDSIVGGPLGEVLQNSSGTAKNVNGWSKGPRFASSPTGVLRKEAAFASRTNSSAGSSPRA